MRLFQPKEWAFPKPNQVALLSKPENCFIYVPKPDQTSTTDNVINSPNVKCEQLSTSYVKFVSSTA